MHVLRSTAGSSADGVVERDFTVDGIPAVLRSPASGADGAPLVLSGHGGGTHKKHPAMAGRARLLVAGGGFHVACVDAPATGDRPRTPHDEREIAELYRARAAGEPEGPVVVRYNAHAAGHRRCPSGGPSWTPSSGCRRSAPTGRSAGSA
ncbi:hypothetical protein GCM10009663_43860 [Kitasatospora arboriphila]|uniref:Alpha/beta hydrolase n=1 Tax=Kitasatospora arboriphila TaxID=258052 RepID=A0ABN1TNV2_9ACTN